MKIKILIIALSFGFFFQSRGQTGFTLNCQLKGLPDGVKAYLIAQYGDTIGKAISKREKVIFTGKLPLDGRFHFISIDPIVSKQPIGVIFLENKLISLNAVLGDKESMVVTGSKGHLEYLDIMSAIEKENEKNKKQLEEIHKSIQKKYQEIGNTKDTISIRHLRQQIIDFDHKVELIEMQGYQMVLKWIEEHSSSLYAPRIIGGYVKDTSAVRLFYDRLTTKAKLSYYGMELKNKIESFKLKLGRILPDFDLISSKGDKVSILSLVKKNKLTLIDFWASWCKPCRAAIPHLKELYGKYNSGGFNIIGVVTAESDKEVAWKKALNDDNTPWDQCMDVTNITKGILPRDGIPSYILVDNKGKIIASDMVSLSAIGLGKQGPKIRGKELENTLKQLLNKH